MEQLFKKVFKNVVLFKKIFKSIDYDGSKIGVMKYDDIISVLLMIKMGWKELLIYKVKRGEYLVFNDPDEVPINKEIEKQGCLVELFSFIRGGNGNEDYSFYNKLFANYYDCHLFKMYQNNIEFIIIKCKCISALQVLVDNHKLIITIDLIKCAINVGDIEILKFILNNFNQDNQDLDEIYNFSLYYQGKWKNIFKIILLLIDHFKIVPTFISIKSFYTSNCPYKNKFKLKNLIDSYKLMVLLKPSIRNNNDDDNDGNDGNDNILNISNFTLDQLNKEISEFTNSNECNGVKELIQFYYDNCGGGGGGNGKNVNTTGCDNYKLQFYLSFKDDESISTIYDNCTNKCIHYNKDYILSLNYGNLQLIQQCKDYVFGGYKILLYERSFPNILFSNCTSSSDSFKLEFIKQFIELVEIDSHIMIRLLVANNELSILKSYFQFINYEPKYTIIIDPCAIDIIQSIKSIDIFNLFYNDNFKNEFKDIILSICKSSSPSSSSSTNSSSSSSSSSSLQLLKYLQEKMKLNQDTITFQFLPNLQIFKYITSNDENKIMFPLNSINRTRTNELFNYLRFTSNGGNIQLKSNDIQFYIENTNFTIDFSTSLHNITTKEFIKFIDWSLKNEIIQVDNDCKIIVNSTTTNTSRIKGISKSMIKEFIYICKFKNIEESNQLFNDCSSTFKKIGENGDLQIILSILSKFDEFEQPNNSDESKESLFFIILSSLAYYGRLNVLQYLYEHHSYIFEKWYTTLEINRLFKIINENNFNYLNIFQ